MARMEVFMGIASFVIGLLCLVLSPFLSVFLILPSLLALLLGIIDTVIKSKKKESRGLSVAGIVLSSIAIVLCIVFVIGIYTLSGVIWQGLETVVAETKGETINAQEGESVELDNVKITLKGVNKDFKDYNDYADIPDGYTVLKADFEFENTEKYTNSVSSSHFKCFVDQFSCDKFNGVDDSYFYESIEPGRKASGSVYFEIPEDAKEIEIEYEPYSWSGKVVFELE